MKFHPTPIIRYCYRYFLVALFILFPIYIMFGMTFNHAMVGEEDRVGFFLLGLVLLIVGSVLIHVGFWEKFFSTLEITEDRVIWRCPFRKKQSMLLDDCVVIGACREHVNTVSLYDPVYYDAGDTIYVMDQIGDCNSDVNWIDEILLKKSINELPEREKRILSLRFMNGLTQTEVANEIGISQAQVSRLEKGALDKIKSHQKVRI